MKFQQTDERRLLEETLTRYLRDNYTLERRHAAARSEDGFDRDTWRDLAELGIVSSLFREEHGGLGGSSHDLSVVFEAVGRHLCVEPLLSTLIAGNLLARSTSNGFGELLGEVVAGERLVSFAHLEAHHRYETLDVRTVVHGSDDGLVLQGDKQLVLNGNAADSFVVSSVDGADGSLELLLVPGDAPGVSLRGVPTVDGGRVANVRFDGVRLDAAAQVASGDAATRMIDEVLGLATIALCAEALGLMSIATEMTLDYLKTRKQFGVTIGSFQSLQHRYVELLIEIEQMRSALINAASHWHDGDAERDWYLSAAKYLAGHSGQLVAEECIQLHGGIAMTWEYPLGHYAKRLVMIDHLLGDTDHHLARCAVARQVPSTS